MRGFDNNGHSFSIRVVFNDVKKLKLVELRLLMMIVLNNQLVVLIPLNELNAIVFGGIHECQLIRRRAGNDRLNRLILRVVASKHCVAKSQVVQESLNIFILGVDLVLDSFVQFTVNHIEVCDLFVPCIFAITVVLTVSDSSDAHFSEDHMVLSDGASLVRYHVRNLAQLF